MTILIVIAAVILYSIVFHYAREWIHSKVRKPIPVGDADDYYRKFPQCKEYLGEEHEWKPVYNLEHCAVTIFNIPFVPEDTEVFYMENNYDEEANLFVKENIDMIRELLAIRGLTFVYLPDISVSKEMAEAMVAYYSPNSEDSTVNNDGYRHGLRSDFLLDYMVYPENRPKLKSGCIADLRLR